MAQAFQYLIDEDGNPLSGVVKTSTFYSKPTSLASIGIFGILVRVTEVGGASPTLDIKVQTSPDGGVEWWDFYAEGEGSQTQAALVTLNADTDTGGQWAAWYGGPDKSSPGINPKIRFAFVIGGTSPTFTIEAFFIARGYS